jgi:hypothetical protein
MDCGERPRTAMLVLRSLSAICVRRCPVVFVGFCLLGSPRSLADTLTFDLMTPGHVVFPSWMPERPLASPKEHAELSFPVIPGPDDDDLVLTVVFNDQIGSYLSVYWVDEEGQRRLLCANLFESIGLPNQRTLLVNRPMMGGPGKIVLQSSESVLNVIRVRLDWARPGVVRLVDGEPNGALVTTGGKMFAPEEVDGTTLTPIADSWEGRILTTSITEHPERIENGVDFQVTVPTKVSRARVEVMINGLPMNESLTLWLNRQAVGTLAVEVPDLTDPGFGGSDRQGPSFIGWRKGVLYLTGDKLPAGENHFQFQGPANVAVAIRDFLLQVEYAAN